MLHSSCLRGLLRLAGQFLIRLTWGIGCFGQGLANLDEGPALFGEPYDSLLDNPGQAAVPFGLGVAFLDNHVAIRNKVDLVERDIPNLFGNALLDCVALDVLLAPATALAIRCEGGDACFFGILFLMREGLVGGLFEGVFPDRVRRAPGFRLISFRFLFAIRISCLQRASRLFSRRSVFSRRSSFLFQLRASEGLSFFYWSAPSKRSRTRTRFARVSSCSRRRAISGLIYS